MPNHPEDEPPADGFEELLSACIEALSTGSEERVDELCAAHPELADRLRDRLATLRSLGFLESIEANANERAETPVFIGRYAIERVLGQGGMSVVYLAWDPVRAERVALKTIHAFTASDDRARTRFEREVRAASQLEHEGIVRVIDTGEAGGRPFFTMEYVEGATLAEIVDVLQDYSGRSDELGGDDVRRVVEHLTAERIAGGGEAEGASGWRQTWMETLCRWVLDVADALAHAHSAGILHRDVKPSNIIVGLDGRVRLFDLGLARLSDLPGLTRSSDFTGTPFYVSPEQLVGGARSVDQRSDVFSLGVTLYELLTFRRPFVGDSTAQVFKRIVDQDPVPPTRVDANIPADLEAICLAAIQKRPADRYQHMRNLAADLKRFVEFRPVRARPLGAARRGLRFVRRRRALSAAAGLAVAIAIGLPLVLLWANRAISNQRDLAHANELEAIRQAEFSQQVTDYLVDLFLLTPGEAERAESVTAREILDRGARSIPSGFEGQPLARAALMRANGRVYHNLGVTDEAKKLLDRALAIFQRELGEHHVETARLLQELAQVHLAAGDRAASVQLCRRSLAGFEAAGSADDPLAVRCRITLADAARGHEERALALHLLEEVLQGENGDSRLVPDVWERIGRLHVGFGHLEEARHAFETAIEMRRSSWVPDPLGIAEALEELARVELELSGEERAELLAAESRELRRNARLGAKTLPGEVVESGPFRLRPPWQDEYDDAFQEGITSLQTGDHAEARAAFDRCLELSPGHTICAYNLACSYALAGEVDTALDWVARAIEFGFGYLSDGPSVLAKDPDLDELRSTARWPELMADVSARRAEVEGYTRSPAIYRPPGLEPSDEVPLLVVLHADGASKDDVVTGPWRSVADRLGTVLLAPSAAIPAVPGVDGTSGAGPEMRWFREIDNYLDRPWAYEVPVIEAIRAFCDENAVERSRVFIAGEGMGTLLAANIALTAPGLFRGVLLVNGPLHPELAGDRAAVAKSIGIGIEVLLDGREPVAAWPAGASLQELADGIVETARNWGLADRLRVSVVEAAASPSAADALLAGMLSLGKRSKEVP